METHELFEGVGSLLEQIRTYLLPIMLTATAVGTLSMALIQTMKDMFSLRSFYQRSQIRKWIGERLSELERWKYMIPAGDGTISVISNNRDNILQMEEKLLELSVNGDAKALYSLPIEQLCGQLNTALQVCLDYPQQHARLLALFGARANPDDIRKVLEYVPGNIPGELLTQRQQQQVSEYMDARNRLSNQVQRAIDSIQVSVGHGWQYNLQLSSIVVSSLLVLSGLLMKENPNYWLILPLAVLGGFLAPVARDLVAVLQNLRTK